MTPICNICFYVYCNNVCISDCIWSVSNTFASLLPALLKCPLHWETGGMMPLSHKSMARPSLWICASPAKVSGHINSAVKLVKTHTHSIRTPSKTYTHTHSIRTSTCTVSQHINTAPMARLTRLYLYGALVTEDLWEACLCQIEQKLWIHFCFVYIRSVDFFQEGGADLSAGLLQRPGTLGWPTLISAIVIISVWCDCVSC